MEKELTITIKILDYWLKDNYKLGTNSTVYVLMEIDNKLSLKEMDLKNE